MPVRSVVGQAVFAVGLAAVGIGWTLTGDPLRTYVTGVGAIIAIFGVGLWVYAERVVRKASPTAARTNTVDQAGEKNVAVEGVGNTVNYYGAASTPSEPAPATPPPMQREVWRDVRDLVSGAMGHAEEDREHGMDDRRAKARAAANHAGARAHEIDDEQGRRLVLAWKEQFDAIPKGWKEPALISQFSSERRPPGYPEPAWGDLRKSADAAVARLGALLRGGS